ncbi:hypothetical protein PF004_g26558 [Phytophthora fragariae]|uniref:Uncharacterized protein n=1 Tax=Phytophthora fragariae TaxID=53985 RepID=A0A6G0MNU1_9STRA|nr:hypothetical protein PF004_g26558 [Phytophthora fragariae]
MRRSRHINPKSSSERTSCSFRNEHAYDADLRYACCICSRERGRRYLSDDCNIFSLFVVTSTVTTSSSPKRTTSVGEYHKTRGKVIYASENLFDGMEDLDMEEGEEERESSSSGRDESSVGTRRPREDDSDASSSKRSRSGIDRPLADAGALPTPRDGDDDDSTPSATVTSRTGFPISLGRATPVGRHALYSCNAIDHR